MHNEPQAKKSKSKTEADLEARIEALKAEIAEPKTQVPVQRANPLPTPEEQERLLSVRDKWHLSHDLGAAVQLRSRHARERH